jgi:hypothetical protein
MMFSSSEDDIIRANKNNNKKRDASGQGERDDFDTGKAPSEPSFG